MAAKTVQVSDDNGSNWYTLPGNSGEFSDEAGSLDDTIFGQLFQSGQPNLIGWSVNANALFKGFAGYTVDIKKTGTPTTMTDEAMSSIATDTYQVTASTKRILDPDTTIVVEDNNVAVAASNIEYIDYLFGIVKFITAYTPTEPITITGKYLPQSILAKYRNFTLTMTMDPIDNTDIPAAQANSGHRTFDPAGLKTVTLETSGVYDSTNGYRTDLVARTTLVIEVNPDGASQTVARGFFKPTARGQSGNVGDLEEETASFTLFVPSNNTDYVSKMQVPFRWNFSSSTLSTAVQKCITAWQNATALDVRYLSDGVNGLKGDCVVADVSLSGGLDAMNEFSVSLQGTGVVTAVP